MDTAGEQQQAEGSTAVRLFAPISFLDGIDHEPDTRFCWMATATPRMAIGT